jgi:large subunit ribosomal protein LP1
MAAVEVSQLSKNEHAQLACTYASLVLHDDGLEISASNINKLLQASGNKVEAFWPGIFSKAL